MKGEGYSGALREADTDWADFEFHLLFISAISLRADSTFMLNARNLCFSEYVVWCILNTLVLHYHLSPFRRWITPSTLSSQPSFPCSRISKATISRTLETLPTSTKLSLAINIQWRSMLSNRIFRPSSRSLIPPSVNLIKMRIALKAWTTLWTYQ
jgi:hypothetical protein